MEAMKRFAWRFLRAILALGLPVILSTPTAADDYMVVPGERMGDLYLTMAVEEVVKLL